MIWVETLFQEGDDSFWLAVSEQQNMSYILVRFLVYSSTIRRGKIIDFWKLVQLHRKNTDENDQN
jgi:flagella basal body P-ring formation protein FlgA